MAKIILPLSGVYGLLEPGPVVMVTTAQGKRANVMTMSWYTMMEFEPPLVGCVISNRNYSFSTLKTTGECAINIPALELADKVAGCGNTSGRKIDKFTAFGLTQTPASLVRVPLIKECFANLECRVIDGKMVTKYNFFILEVLRAWIDAARKNARTLHHRGKGAFMVAGRTLKAAARTLRLPTVALTSPPAVLASAATVNLPFSTLPGS